MTDYFQKHLNRKIKKDVFFNVITLAWYYDQTMTT